MKTQTLVDVVRLYRDVAFFAEHQQLSDVELAEQLNTQYRAVHHKDIDPDGDLADLGLLSLDKERLWWADLEDDVFFGRNAYVEILQQWARISRGAFQPKEIVERWGKDSEPPVTISFQLGDRPYRLRTDVDEWIDLGLLKKINRLIRPSGIGFYTLATGDQTGAVVALTKAEKARWQRARPAVFDHEASYAGGGLPEGYAYWIVDEAPPVPEVAEVGTWLTVASQGAPGPRTGHLTVWTGTEMLVLGGDGPGLNEWLADGAAYDPEHDKWRQLASEGAPSARQQHIWTWNGSELFMWGGYSKKVKSLGDGARYAPDRDIWQPLPTRRGPGHRWGVAACAWTGNEVLVWGGSRTQTEHLGTGAAYDPNTDSWRPIATERAPSQRSVLVGTWTGQELLVWGGRASSSDDLRDGALYNPNTDTWRPIAPGGPSLLDASRPTPSIWTWTGSELLIWARPHGAEPAQGWAYQPTQDRWRPLSHTHGPSEGAWQVGFHVWTGSAFVVWLGPEDGAVYDYAADEWRQMAATGAPRRRRLATAICIRDQVLVWGGDWPAPEADRHRYSSVMYGDGALYDVASDRWRAVPLANSPRPRFGHSGIWTGAEVVLWGGSFVGQVAERFDDGARLRI